MENSFLKLDRQALAEAVNKIPSGDLIAERWDAKEITPPTKLIVLLSTPRSGSTYFCQKLLEGKICIAHEYFQPFEYMPIAADRWGCIVNDEISINNYTQKLISKRTMDNGILGINLHGHHIPYFENVLHLFSSCDITYIHIERREKLKQAISYEIASQSSNWSSEYSNKSNPKFNRESIKRRLEKIESMNSDINLFLKRNNVYSKHIFFEDFVSQVSVLTELVGENSPFEAKFPFLKLEKQSSALNESWITRYERRSLMERLREAIRSYSK